MGAAAKFRTCTDNYFELLQRQLAVYRTFDRITAQDAESIRSNAKQVESRLTPALRQEINAVLAKAT